MTRLFGLLAVICLAASGCAPTIVPKFYYNAPVAPGSRHGDLIRYEKLAGAPDGAHAYRIAYLSTAADGRLFPVSGMVIIPASPAPADGRRVIAWGHPTTGVLPKCAPSISHLRFLMTFGLPEMLKRGFVVAATDYPGLGIGTIHPFLDGESEGRAVLDSIRAAAAIPGASTSTNFGLWGHSQGGQAVLFAAHMSVSYTPELRLAGVAAAAPATNLATLFRDDSGTVEGDNLSALTLWSWAHVFDAAYTNVVTPESLPAIKTVADRCLDTLIPSSAKRRADKVLAKSYFTVPDITVVEPWRSLIARNTPAPLPRQIPVFLAQGSADVVVRPPVTYHYAARLCAAGSRLALNTYPDVDHDWIADKSAPDAMSWMEDRFAGQPPPDQCHDLRAREASPEPPR